MLRVAWKRTSLFTKPRVLPTRGIDEFYDTTTKVDEKPHTGRPWRASELRQKSFSDLHKLWFILLKERNLLMTQRAEARSTKDKSVWRNPYRLKKVRLSMARIKVVLGERERIVKSSKQRVRELYALEKQERAMKERLEKMKQELPEEEQLDITKE